MLLTRITILTQSGARSISSHPQSIRSLSNEGTSLSHKLRYSPSKSDIIKTLSNRDKRFFNHIKKVRSSYSSSVLNDPPVLTRGFYPTDITNQGVYMGSTFLEHPPQPLPQLHASAFLDPKGYCRSSAQATTTISGGDAARRLIRGKRNLVETMRKEIQEQQYVKKLYILKGHGVPDQVLNHLLDAAQQWLPMDAHEVAVQNLFGALNFDRYVQSCILFLLLLSF